MTKRALAAALLLVACTPGEHTFVRVASGPAGGSWYPLGAKMAEEFESSIPGVAASAGPGAGVVNIRDVGAGQAEVGLTYGHSAYDAFVGAPPFTKAHTNLRHLASLYPAAFQAAVPITSNIRSYRDLADRNLSPGAPTGSGYSVFEMIMARYGLSAESVRASGGTVHLVSYADTAALMKDGHIDAAFAITSLPQAFLLDLEFRPGIRFLPVEEAILDELIQENPGYVRIAITNEHYASVPEPVATLGAVTTLVVNESLPEDLAYAMTRTLWEKHAEFVAVADVWAQARLERALVGAAVPVHPGAMRYYVEQGVAAERN